MRVTGTGTAYRRALDEFVYRPPENYLTPEFLARCNGLPVIYEHPKGRTLNSQEFSDRVIGSVMLPFIRGDEVWCVARIYDSAAATILRNEQMSTSPAVIFRDIDENSILTFSDGAEILIEGKPSTLDHLAVCEQGVWDKGNAPSGVESNMTGAVTMTEEELKAKADAEEAAKKEAEEKAKADAAAGEDSRLDKIMDVIQGLCTRMDSMEKSRADADETAKKEAEEKVKADKAKADAAGAPEYLSKADADKIRQDMAELASRVPHEVSDSEREELAEAQSKADSVASYFGQRAPAPLSGETSLAYRQRLAAKYKSHSQQYKDINLSAINDSALFGIVENAIYADAQAAAMNPADVAAGVLREIRRPDATGRQISTFAGDPASTWAPFQQPVRRVAMINK
ncbi:hypothetical protein [Martelella alba]|nr:hypothetical protein [Martelella alba]